MAAKLQMVFMGSDCDLIIDSSLLNSKNLFLRLIIPKVSTNRTPQIGNYNDIHTNNKMVIDSFSTIEEADKAMFEFNPNDLSILSIDKFIPLFSDPRFKKSRLVSIKKLLATLLLGVIYFLIGFLIIYVSWAVTYVVFLRGWYGLFVVYLYLTTILTTFVVMFFFQGIVYPLFILFGNPHLTCKSSELLENINEGEFILLKYRLGFITGMKIKLHTILGPKIIKSNKEFALEISLDNHHHLQLPLGKIL